VVRPGVEAVPGRAVVSAPDAPRATPEDLAAEAQAGSREAFSELVLRFQGPLFHFLSLRVTDAGEAEELVQEAFLRAWQKLHQYDSRWRFSTWLFTVAKSLAASRARVRKPVLVHDEVLTTLAAEGEPSALVELREESDNVWLLAGRILSVEQRSALWLRYAEDLSIEEVARILGKRRVTVRVLLFRAREALAGRLNARPPAGERS
jgi:RNA polymerase sigma-70 factor (ECF subfamily)